MKYTDRLKILAAADIIFIGIMAALFILMEMDRFHNYGLAIAVIVIAGGGCVAASIYSEKGECRKWRRIWKDPVWQTAGYIILAVAFIASLWVFPLHEHLCYLFGPLIMVNALIRDVRYYRYAVRFGMDDLNDVNELAEKYPEAGPLINRKQKTDMESDWMKGNRN